MCELDKTEVVPTVGKYVGGFVKSITPDMYVRELVRLLCGLLLEIQWLVTRFR